MSKLQGNVLQLEGRINNQILGVKRLKKRKYPKQANFSPLYFHLNFKNWSSFDFLCSEGLKIIID